MDTINTKSAIVATAQAIIKTAEIIDAIKNIDTKTQLQLSGLEKQVQHRQQTSNETQAD